MAPMRWNYDPRLDPTDGTKLTWCDDCQRYCQDFAGHDCFQGFERTAQNEREPTNELQN